MSLVHRIQALLVVMIWGLDFVVAKVVINHFPPFFLLTLRFGIAGVLLIPFLKKLPISYWKLIAISLTFSIVHAGLIYLSLRMGLSASVSVIAGQMRVPLALILSVVFLHEVIKWRSITGVTLSIIGTLVLVGAPNVLNNYWAFLAALGGALGWAVYNTLVKMIPEVEYFTLMGWISIISTPFLFLISLAFEKLPLHHMPDIPWGVFIGMLYLVSISTILSQSLWYMILRKYEVNQIAPYTLMVPVMGIISAVLFLSESLSAPAIIGGILTIAGVGIVVWRRPTIAEPTKKE